VPTLDEYYAPIGKLTIAAAKLEEVALGAAALLSDDPMDETRYKNITRGLDNNLNLLADLVKERVSSTNQGKVLDLIERGRTLKNKRNENVHCVWGQMVHADSGKLAGVVRSRYDKHRATRSTMWDLTVPSTAELEKLASDLDQVGEDLRQRLADLWDIDEGVRDWRMENGY
jgi:hypothetical protein